MMPAASAFTRATGGDLPIARAVIGAAAADGGHRFVDILVARVRRPSAARSRQDHGGLAALRHVERHHAFCTGCEPSGDRPSMVVIFRRKKLDAGGQPHTECCSLAPQ
jgi:hypothetical protein